MENSNVIPNKPTLIARAQLQISGFDAMWHRLEQAIILGGHSPSTLPIKKVFAFTISITPL